MPYVTPAQLTIFYDTTRVLDLCTDGDTPAVLADLSNAASDAYAIAIQACRDASSDIDQRCQQGRRYTRADLEAVVADALANPSDETKQKRASALKRLTADLAFYYLMARRGFTADKIRSIAPRADAALEALDQLSVGIRILDLDPQLASAGPIRVKLGVKNYQPSRGNRLFGVWVDAQSNNGGFLWDC